MRALSGCGNRWMQGLASNSRRFISFKPHDLFQGHNHALDPMAVPVSTVKEKLKRRAIDTREPPKQIRNYELQSAPVSLGPSLPSSAVRKMIRRVRVKNSIPVVEGANVQNINIPIDCQRYVDADGNEEMFLLGDSGTDDAQRILIFGRQKHIEIEDRRLSISSREKFQEENFCVRSLSALQQSRVLSQSKDDSFAGICSASQGLGIV
uniref:Uncharacterized protein n=1 Tax=Ditylenchus dipsaci TaxID=166011 RepID=A0A915ETE0_9BILA